MSRVFDFNNYLEFLHAEVKRLKASDPEWTISKWAREMSFSNVVGLHMILKGIRRPGPQSIPKFIQFFNFSDREETYFRNLVKKDLLSKNEEASAFVEEKLKIIATENRAKHIDEAEFNVIADWYHSAIQQLLSIEPAPAEVEYFQQKLKYNVSAAQIQSALDNLEKLNLITKKDGKYFQSHSAIRTSSDVPSEAIRRHHEQMLQNAAKAIREVPVTDRQIQGRTIVVRKQDFEKAAEMIRSFSEKFGVEIDQQNGEQVYQLNIQFFPLSEGVER